MIYANLSEVRGYGQVLCLKIVSFVLYLLVMSDIILIRRLRRMLYL